VDVRVAGVVLRHLRIGKAWLAGALQSNKTVPLPQAAAAAEATVGLGCLIQSHFSTNS
jgi:hypothetical protein